MNHPDWLDLGLVAFIGAALMWLVDTAIRGRLVRRERADEAEQWRQQCEDAYNDGRYVDAPRYDFPKMTRQLQEAERHAVPLSPRAGSGPTGNAHHDVRHADRAADDAPALPDTRPLQHDDQRAVRARPAGVQEMQDPEWHDTPEHLAELAAPYYPPACDCLMNPAITKRQGGAVVGCPVHDSPGSDTSPVDRPVSGGLEAVSGPRGSGGGLGVLRDNGPVPAPDAYDPTWFPRGMAFVAGWHRDAWALEQAGDEWVAQWVAESREQLAAVTWHSRMLEGTR